MATDARAQPWVSDIGAKGLAKRGTQVPHLPRMPWRPVKAAKCVDMRSSR